MQKMLGSTPAVLKSNARLSCQTLGENRCLEAEQNRTVVYSVGCIVRLQEEV